LPRAVRVLATARAATSVDAVGGTLERSISDEYLNEVVTREREKDADYAAERILLKIGKLRQATDGDRILDIGCGTGVITAAFARLGLSPSGIEVVPEFIEVARGTHPALEFLVGAGERLPFTDESYDFVVLSEVLEHVDDWRRTLAEAARVLRKGGVLYLSTTNRLWPVQGEIRHLHGFGYLPAVLQRRVYALAAKRRPEWIGYTHRPAVHWFTWRGLSRELRRLGLQPYSWPQLIDEDDFPASYRRHRRAIMALSRSRLGIHAVLPQGTNIVATKNVAEAPGKVQDKRC